MCAAFSLETPRAQVIRGPGNVVVARRTRVPDLSTKHTVAGSRIPRPAREVGSTCLAHRSDKTAPRIAALAETYLVVVGVTHEVIATQGTRGAQPREDEVLTHARQHLVDFVAHLVAFQHLAVQRRARPTEPLRLRRLRCLCFAVEVHTPWHRTGLGVRVDQ